MDDNRAQLTSLATALDELTQRITRLADGYTGAPEENTAGELYEIERMLVQASRRLDRLVREP
jgi:hypothetical protein